MENVTLRTRRSIAFLAVAFLTLSGALPALLQPGMSLANHSQCSDGVDNDANGRFDYPQDLSCDSLDDQYEGEGNSAVFATITDGKDTITAGDTSIYVITLLQQRDAVKDVWVEMHVPAEVDLISADRGGQITDKTIRWNTLALQNNTPLRLTVQSRVKTTARMDSLVVARVTTDGGMTATDTTKVRNDVNVPFEKIFDVSLTDGRDFIETQASVVYKLSATNRTNDERVARVQVFIPDNIVLAGAPAGAQYDGHKLTWNAVVFRPNERIDFAFSTRIPERLQNYRPIYVRARVGNETASDTTVIRTGFPENGLNVSLKADRTEAKRGDIIHYTVTVRNETDKLATMAAVNASLPIYSEFLDVSDGGQWDGSTIHWRNMQIAAGSERTLGYRVRVRDDAPQGGKLLATVDASGSKDSLNITVSDRTTVSTNTAQRPSRSSTLLRKVADRSEMLPGGTVRYTIMVQNVLLHVIDDAVVTDRFDPQFLSIADSGNAQIVGQGEMQWKVPALQPGQRWETSYVLSISKNAPNGYIVKNIARITGTDVNDAAFSERVIITQTGVMTHLPATGAPFDILVGLFLSPLALATALVQRRLIAA